MTRFVVALQAAPAVNEVGLAAASSAPARAALSIATWEWKIRARSAPAASRTSRTGRITASSTIAWPRERPRANGRQRRAAGPRGERLAVDSGIGMASG